MLNREQINDNRDLIVRLLTETNRAGIPALLEWLEECGFYESPGSTKYHGCYAGGLAQHSLNVFGKYIEISSICGVEVPADSVTIACLLHDVCKAGAYLGVSAPYQYNRNHPDGHAKLSLDRLDQFIPLSYLERRMIKFHMGIYGSSAPVGRYGEYTLLELKDAFEDPAIKLMTFADELVTLWEKSEEKEYREKHGSLEAIA